MCGVFGVVRPGGVSSADRDAFARLSSQLLHRGPDGFTEMEQPGVLVGMHRLSIIDVEHGWPPFWSQDRTVSVLANGEIYNAPELAADLRAAGRNLRSHSDLEVIPHLYADHGLNYVAHLRGMFAIAVLDARRETLVLTRDRLGEKPLFYCQIDGAIWFSSEMSALVRAGIVPANINLTELPNYLTFGYVPEPETIVAGISRVPAGHHLEIGISTGSMGLCKYWDPLAFLADGKPSIGQLEHLIREAVRLNVRSDVPVAVALSSGIDSSLVASLAHQARGDIHAISVGYAESASTDESSMASDLARDLDMPFHKIELSSSDVSRGFEGVCQRRDEPISDIAGPGYDALARTARDLGFPVLLNGQGGDELFWGYPWVLRLAQHAHQLTLEKKMNPTDVVPHQLGPLANWWDDRGGLRTNRTIRQCLATTSGELRVPLYRLQVGHNSIGRQIAHLLPGQFMSGVLDYPQGDLAKYWGLFGVGMIDTYLKSNGLAQMDRLTMAHSVEGRTPLVDYRVAECALSTMADSTVLHRPPKVALKEVASRVLPDYIIARPKMGFTPPVREWIRGIWHTHAQSLQSPLLAQIDVFDESHLLQTLQTPIQKSGRVNQVALRLLTLELWLRGIT